jgi:membrane associated rhomboid family serine protease
MSATKHDIAIWSIIIAVSITCIGVFFLPRSIQNDLTYRTNAVDPLNFLTSIFVHGSLQHLLGNLVVFLLTGSLLFYFNRKIGKEEFLFYSLLVIVLILPIVYGIIFQQFANLYKWQTASYGLSLVVAGCLGLVIPTLILFLREDLQNSASEGLLFLGMFALTGATIILPYTSSINSSYLFITLYCLGLVASVYIILKTLAKTAPERRKNVLKRLLLGLGCFFACLVFILMLFPSNLSQTQGSVVNILAHFIGLIFGIAVGLVTLLSKTVLTFKSDIKHTKQKESSKINSLPPSKEILDSKKWLFF